MGSLWIVVGRCGIVVDRCGSLWVVVGRCGSFRVSVTTVNREACSLPSALRFTYCQISYTCLACSLDHKHMYKGKGMYFGFQQPFVGRSVA